MQLRFFPRHGASGKGSWVTDYVIDASVAVEFLLKTPLGQKLTGLVGG